MENIMVELSARALAKFEIAYKWDTRKFQSIGKRPSFEKWLETTLNTDVAKKLCDYAEAQAEASMKRIAVQYAEQENVTILEAYEALGLRSRSDEAE